MRVEEGDGLSVEADERQICIDGVRHGSTYRVQVRKGLPAADGELLERTLDLELRVGDRPPSARFLGRAYVLPKGGEAAIPVISVNADRLSLVLYHIGERSIAQVLGEGPFLKQLKPYQAERIRDHQGQELRRGTLEVQAQLNREVTTAVPVDALVPDLKPGVYALTAEPTRTLTPSGEANGDQTCDEGCGQAPATQWFVVSDLGLTVLQGNDGLHTLVRSLASATPLAGARVRLIARNNEVLSESVTDAAGYAQFEPGLLRGIGGNAPALVTAELPDGDLGFLDLARSPFELSDRGVKGRPAPKPLDVYLVPDRGIYRPGETVHLTALVRDSRAEARAGIPLTLPVLDGKSRIGIRPLFEGEAEEGGGAGFEVVALGADGARRPASGLAWTLERVQTDFQWYRGEDGSFDYEPIEHARRVASGALDLGADPPGRIEVPVEWGGYRLRIEGDGLVPASLGFEAGWYVAPHAADAPDQLKLSLDKPRYRVGERARVHIEPRGGGAA